MKAAEAILGGALAASVLTTLGLLVLNLLGNEAFTFERLAGFSVWLSLSFLLTAGFASTLGLAWHALASGRGWHSVHHYWVPGALTGFVTAMLVFSVTPVAAIYFGFLATLLGGITGLFAWLIRRPDRDVANPPTSKP